LVAHRRDPAQHDEGAQVERYVAVAEDRTADDSENQVARQRPEMYPGEVDSLEIAVPTQFLRKNAGRRLEVVAGGRCEVNVARIVAEVRQ
jgi:hypothetical protein